MEAATHILELQYNMIKTIKMEHSKEINLASIKCDLGIAKSEVKATRKEAEEILKNSIMESERAAREED
jgi:hypothetical protein